MRVVASRERGRGWVQLFAQFRLASLRVAFRDSVSEAMSRFELGNQEDPDPTRSLKATPPSFPAARRLLPQATPVAIVHG